VKNKLSSFMDGELEQKDISNVITAIKEEGELYEQWKIYHLIGDSLRQSSRLSMNISPSVSKKLKSEPTVFSPVASMTSTSNTKKQRYKVFAFSIAASVVAMVSGWLVMQNIYEPPTLLIAEQTNRESNLNVAPAMVSTPPSIHNFSHPPIEMNDYLFVHREFSPGVTPRGHVTTVNSATEYHERYGR